MRKIRKAVKQQSSGLKQQFRKYEPQNSIYIELAAENKGAN